MTNTYLTIMSYPIFLFLLVILSHSIYPSYTHTHHTHSLLPIAFIPAEAAPGPPGKDEKSGGSGCGNEAVEVMSWATRDCVSQPSPALADSAGQQEMLDPVPAVTWEPDNNMTAVAESAEAPTATGRYEKSVGHEDSEATRSGEQSGSYEESATGWIHKRSGDLIDSMIRVLKVSSDTPPPKEERKSEEIKRQDKREDRGNSGGGGCGKQSLEVMSTAVSYGCVPKPNSAVADSAGRHAKSSGHEASGGGWSEGTSEGNLLQSLSEQLGVPFCSRLCELAQLLESSQTDEFNCAISMLLLQSYKAVFVELQCQASERFQTVVTPLLASILPPNNAVAYLKLSSVPAWFIGVTLDGYSLPPINKDFAIKLAVVLMHRAWGDQRTFSGGDDSSGGAASSWIGGELIWVDNPTNPKIEIQGTKGETRTLVSFLEDFSIEDNSCPCTDADVGPTTLDIIMQKHRVPPHRAHRPTTEGQKSCRCVTTRRDRTTRRGKKRHDVSTTRRGEKRIDEELETRVSDLQRMYEELKQNSTSSDEEPYTVTPSLASVLLPTSAFIGQLPWSLWNFQIAFIGVEFRCDSTKLPRITRDLGLRVTAVLKETLHYGSNFSSNVLKLRIRKQSSKVKEDNLNEGNNNRWIGSTLHWVTEERAQPGPYRGGMKLLKPRIEMRQQDGGKRTVLMFAALYDQYIQGE
eukprot:GHVQ01030131.1.p1 GENE.GHVQ01030131.1~~GHVQ01030131.1.p1  ORF type:complete len:689 (-),score=102.55 GHVQ01030131.1:136-2202(-)